MKLELQNLAFHYSRAREIFHDVNLTLEAGELLSVLGANGAGKSTLLSCIAGLYRPCAGQILLDGKPLASMSRMQIARRIGCVPQLHESTFAYSVLEYTVMGRTPYIRSYSRPDRQDYDITREALRRVGADGLEHRIFSELSGGEQQLVTIARVLAQQPELILFDEPTNHLDFGNRARTLDILRGLTDDGYTIIVTTHDPDHALQLGGRAAILDSTGTLTDAPAGELLTPERLSALYGLPVGTEYLPSAGRVVCFARSEREE